MNKFILAFIMIIVMTSVSYADSNVYIVQSGGGNVTLDIVLDGNSNTVGTSGNKNLLTGANLGVDIDLVGAGNTVMGDFVGGGEDGETDLKIDQLGSTNVTTIAVGGNSATDDVHILVDRTGSSAVESYTVGSSASVQDVRITADVVGDDIDIMVLENSTATGSDKLTDINIATDSDVVDIDVTHAGGGAHNTILTCTTGTSCAASSFQISQTGANSTFVDVTVGGSSTDVDVTITD